MAWTQKIFLFGILVFSSVSFADLSTEIQTDAKKINEDIRPIQRDIQRGQSLINELYSFEDPTFYPVKNNHLTLSFSPFVAFRRKSADLFSLTTAISNKLTQQRYFSQQSITNEVPNNTIEADVGFDSFFNTKWETQPSFHLGVYNTAAEKSIFGFKGNFTTYLFGISNAVRLSDTTNLLNEISFAYKVNRATDPTTNVDALNDTINEWGIAPQLDFKKAWGTFSVITSATIARITTSANIPDLSHSQSLGFRWSFDKPANMYEFGINRFERVYQSLMTQLNYGPYISAKWVHIEGSPWSLALGYQLLLRIRTDQNQSFNPQQVTLIPGRTVYSRKPESSFWPRFSQVEVSLPVRVTMNSGVNNRVNLGVRLDGAANVINNATVKPAISFEYDRYYQTNTDGFGVHLSMGM